MLLRGTTSSRFPFGSEASASEPKGNLEIYDMDSDAIRWFKASATWCITWCERVNVDLRELTQNSLTLS